MQQPGEPRVASSCLKVGSLGQPARAVNTPQKPRPRGRLRYGSQIDEVAIDADSSRAVGAGDTPRSAPFDSPICMTELTASPSSVGFSRPNAAVQDQEQPTIPPQTGDFDS